MMIELVKAHYEADYSEEPISVVELATAEDIYEGRVLASYILYEVVGTRGKCLYASTITDTSAMAYPAPDELLERHFPEHAGETT